MFQSTHSRGVRRSSHLFFLLLIVSIHALTRSATSEQDPSKIRATFQSTHSRGVRLLHTRRWSLDRSFQSTHSRGVRPAIVAFCQVIRVSIHALTRSATPIEALSKMLGHRFQSTHSRGVRLHFGQSKDEKYYVSIHALTRSATRLSEGPQTSRHGFNPRTHEECDGR